MTSEERNRQMNAARIRAELTVQDLWLRYVGLGGTDDAFAIDGYLQALTPLDTFQQDVLAQALNEALQELYEAHIVPLSTPAAVDDRAHRLDRFVAELLDEPGAARRPDPQRRDDGTS